MYKHEIVYVHFKTVLQIWFKVAYDAVAYGFVLFLYYNAIKGIVHLKIKIVSL